MTIEDPSVAHIQLGILLRRLREDADLTAAEAAKHLDCSTAKMSKVENGKQGLSLGEVTELLDLFGADDAQSAEALKLAAVPRRRRRRRSSSYRDAVPERFRRFLVLESEASTVSAYENEVVHGLLQTEDYARTLLRGGSPHVGNQEIDRQAAIRTNRQTVLTRTELAPLALDVILNEAALHRVIGSDEIMRAQLAHLLEMAELPNVDIRVLPFRPKSTPDHDEAFVTQTSFMLLKLPDQGTVLYLEDFASGTYPEDVIAIQQYAAAYQRLRLVAEDPAGSRKLIGRVARQYA